MELKEWAIPGTRAEALQRWREFLPKARDYASLRNRVEPGHPHVTRLSWAIRTGMVSTHELVQDLLARFPFKAVEKLVQELLWRDYWKGWLELRPGVWTAFREEVERWRQEGPADVIERAREVMAGRGGIAVMDGFARELVSTGYLHNHARMWWAGYWCHVERLPWALGADFFHRHLLDADPASNTLGWRWVAGLQTRGKAYLPRRSNLERFCSHDLLSDRSGIERLEDERVTAAPVPPEPGFSPRPWTRLSEVPLRMEGRWGLWVHGEDLAVETSRLGELQPAWILTVLDEPRTKDLGLSSQRVRSIRHALHDARSRAAAHFGCPAQHLEDSAGVAAALARVAREQRLAGWISMRPAVGPLGDAIQDVERALADAGVGIQWCRRTWAETWWPLARSGFFPFWEKARHSLDRKPPTTGLQLPLPGLDERHL